MSMMKLLNEKVSVRVKTALIAVGMSTLLFACSNDQKYIPVTPAVNPYTNTAVVNPNGVVTNANGTVTANGVIYPSLAAYQATINPNGTAQGGCIYARCQQGIYVRPACPTRVVTGCKTRARIEIIDGCSDRVHNGASVRVCGSRSGSSSGSVDSGPISIFAKDNASTGGSNTTSGGTTVTTTTTTSGGSTKFTVYDQSHPSASDHTQFFSDQDGSTHFLYMPQKDAMEYYHRMQIKPVIGTKNGQPVAEKYGQNVDCIKVGLGTKAEDFECRYAVNLTDGVAYAFHQHNNDPKASGVKFSNILTRGKEFGGDVNSPDTLYIGTHGAEGKTDAIFMFTTSIEEANGNDPSTQSAKWLWDNLQGTPETEDMHIGNQPIQVNVKRGKNIKVIQYAGVYGGGWQAEVRSDVTSGEMKEPRQSNDNGDRQVGPGSNVQQQAVDPVTTNNSSNTSNNSNNNSANTTPVSTSPNQGVTGTTTTLSDGDVKAGKDSTVEAQPDVQRKLGVLQAAQTDLDAKQQAQTAAQADYSAKKQALDDANAAVDAAQKAADASAKNPIIDHRKARLTDLNNAQKVRDGRTQPATDALTALGTANTDVAVAQTKADAAQTDLENQRQQARADLDKAAAAAAADQAIKQFKNEHKPHSKTPKQLNALRDSGNVKDQALYQAYITAYPDEAPKAAVPAQKK